MCPVCVDINECSINNHNCLPTQRCDNTIGSYVCTVCCSQSFYQDNQEIMLFKYSTEMDLLWNRIYT